MNHMPMSNTTMFVISIIAGFFVTMNTWVYESSDIRLLHMNDIYMILLMAVLMIFFSMVYMRDSNTNMYMICIFAIIILFYAIRQQFFVDDVQYLRGMIPHHSMAVLMSKKIKEKSKNPQVINLANNIIESQNREINLMKNILISIAKM